MTENNTHTFTRYVTDRHNNFKLLICNKTGLNLRYEDDRIFKLDKKSNLLIYCPYCGEKL